MDLRGRFDAMHSTIRDFHDKLEEQVVAVKKLDYEQYDLIQNCILHIDGVLQLETERREKKIAGLRVALTTLLEHTERGLRKQMDDIEVSRMKQFEELRESVGKADRAIDAERATVEEAVRTLSSASEKTFAAATQRLAQERAAMIRDTTACSDIIFSDTRKAADMLARGRLDREMGVDSFCRDAEGADKAFESTASEGITSLAATCASIKTDLGEETKAREASHDQIARCLAASTEGLQNTMKRLTDFCAFEPLTG